MRYVSTLLMLLIVLYHSVEAQIPKTDINSILEKAYELNPELKLLLMKAEISDLSVAENSNLPDPVLGLGLTNLPVESFRFDQEPMTGKTLSLSQSFPFPGKLSARCDVLSLDSDINLQDYQWAKLNLRKEIIDSYYSLSYQQKKLSLFKEKLSVFEALIPIVKARYEVAEVSQQNLISLQLRISNIWEKLTELKSREDEIRWTISGLTGENFDYDLSDKLDSLVTSVPDKAILTDMLKGNNPQLIQTELQLTKSDKLFNLSEYEFYPNFNVSVQYTQRDKMAVSGINQNDFFTAAIGITLPLNYGGKSSATQEKTLKLKDQYQSLYDNQYLRLSISINRSTTKIEANNKRISLLNNVILLQARENYKSAISAYQVGKIDFMNVIESLNKLLDYEDELYAIRLESIKEMTTIEVISGTALL